MNITPASLLLKPSVTPAISLELALVLSPAPCSLGPGLISVLPPPSNQGLQPLPSPGKPDAVPRAQERWPAGGLLSQLDSRRTQGSPPAPLGHPDPGSLWWSRLGAEPTTWREPPQGVPHQASAHKPTSGPTSWEPGLYQLKVTSAKPRHSHLLAPPTLPSDLSVSEVSPQGTQTLQIFV